MCNCTLTRPVLSCVLGDCLGGLLLERLHQGLSGLLQFGAKLQQKDLQQVLQGIHSKALNRAGNYLLSHIQLWQANTCVKNLKQNKA